ncbi:MAG: biotin--[acetyl-CoA-carboxylase] ligase [Candidatus Scalindua sp.]|nr:biotin--[acetyl-CoA-carboxylase] ligase [Candidatus Scalindua sp.]
MEKNEKRELFIINGRTFTVYKYARLDSTNTFLRQRCMELEEYSVVWAEEQTKGRGRFDRVWYSSPGKDLTISILLPLDPQVVKYRQNITQITALAVARLLEHYGLKPDLKWPNDVLVNNGKICGILCEIVETGEKTYAVLGIGLNVNSTYSTSPYYDSFITSIQKELRSAVNRREVLQRLLTLICRSFDELGRTGFSQSRKEIKKRLLFVRDRIVIRDGTKNSHSGKILDLNHDGSLLFQCEECNIININSGEITFRINSVNDRFHDQ